MRTWIIIAAVLGLTGVIAGAFGAHALRDSLTEEQLRSYEVGVRYQVYHALALLAVAWLLSLGAGRWARASAALMLVGVILFSGSIYGLALAQWKWLGPVTPVGGSLLILGWLGLAVAGARLPKTTPTQRDAE